MKRLLYILIAVLMFPAASFADDYYWVGGAGNWSDINHWRTSSGGSVIPHVVPGPTDDVYFDANSGFSTGNFRVTVNVLANCRNITFDGAVRPPALSGSGGLNIYGSSVWQAGMSVSASPINYRDSGTPKTITTNGVKLTYTGITIMETTSVSLLDDFEADGAVNVQAGTFNTNGHTLKITNFNAATGTSPRTINLGSSDVYLSGTTFNTNSSSCIVNAGTYHIHFEGVHSVYNTTSGLTGYAGQKFNNVTFENELSTTSPINGDLIINRVEFKGGGYIAGNCTIEELILSSGKQYQIVSGRTLKINKKLSGGAVCSGWLSLNSSASGTKATISMPASATVDITGAIIKDIAATGGASFLAKNSVDNGGNTGWSFPASAGTDLYWVGGDGDWNDAGHWSLSSGGTGGACLPGPNDNVFFDAGSGFTDASKTVSLSAISYCKNITFSGSPVAPELISSLSGNSLNIYGSSVWQSGMTYNVVNTYYQDTQEAKTITSNGALHLGTVYLRETNSISLLDDFSGYAFNVEAGTFNTNDHDFTLSGSFNTNTNTIAKTINLGSSHIYMTGTAFFFSTNNSKTTVNAGTSHIHFTGAITSTTSSYGLNANPGQTFYNLSVDNPATEAASIKATGSTTSATLNFNKVELKGGTLMSGNMKIEELSLAAGKVYSFQDARTVTVNKKLTAGVACGGWTVMKSHTAGSAAIISMPSTASVDVQGVIMSDITGSGGAGFVAVSSINQGNNTGWTFGAGGIKDLYWVGGAGDWGDVNHWSFTSGGAGGACIPGPADNVFFDAGSGFTPASNTVTIESSVFCRDITVAGTATPPEIMSETTALTNILNIYGSSTWQSGQPAVNIPVINYQDTGENKTITSNGVTTGSSGGYSEVNFHETATLSLTDPLITGSNLILVAGTFSTNNFRVDIGRTFSIKGSAAKKTLNLGSSDIYMASNLALFNTRANGFQNSITLNAGTSHIHFTEALTSLNTGLRAEDGQTFYNVSFENTETTNRSELGSNGSASFNRVEFKGGGRLLGNNTFGELVLLSNKAYQLDAGKTQTVNKNLTMSGTPCDVLPISSTTAGTHANLNVTAGTTSFNFVNIKDINATGQTLHFGAQSTAADQNNVNITYDPYNPGVIEGLGKDWVCHIFDNNDPDTYTISSAGFYGNEYTQYQWKKSGSDEVISTDANLDISTFGYGTYTVDVAYTNGLLVTCSVSDDIMISDITPAMQLPEVYKVCIKPTPTYISEVTGLPGQNVKWYATASSTTPLPPTTELIDGQTYYVTQTIDGCESSATKIQLKFGNCDSRVYINPNIRLRVSY